MKRKAKHREQGWWWWSEGGGVRVECGVCRGGDGMYEWSESQARSMYLRTRSNCPRRVELAFRITPAGDVIPVNKRRTPLLTLIVICAIGSFLHARFAERYFETLPHILSI